MMDITKNISILYSMTRLKPDYVGDHVTALCLDLNLVLFRLLQ